MKSNITPSTLRSWARLGQRGTFFAIAMPELGAENRDIRLLTADVAQLSSMSRFQSACPEQFLNVGIAEQNMIGIAAGLAMEGRCVFASTYASFIAVRSLEHIRQHLAYLQCNVKIVGTAAGVVAARSGIAHWATEDISFMRALSGMAVFSAADCLDAYKIAEYAADTKDPMYIRLSGTTNCPIVNQEDYRFVPGRAVKLREGTDAAIFATGLMVKEALDAADILQEKGFSCTVYNVHTIKPLDTEAIDNACRTHRLVVSAEEHNIIGGLGGGIAERMSEIGTGARLMRIGIPDAYSAAGTQRWIWEQNGIDAGGIAARIERELE